MKKVFSIFLICVSLLSLSGFGFTDNPKALSAKHSKALKIQTKAQYHKSVASKVQSVHVEAEEMQEKDLSVFTVFFKTLFSVVYKLVLSIFS